MPTPPSQDEGYALASSSDPGGGHAKAIYIPTPSSSSRKGLAPRHVSRFRRGQAHASFIYQRGVRSLSLKEGANPTRLLQVQEGSEPTPRLLLQEGAMPTPVHYLQDGAKRASRLPPPSRASPTVTGGSQAHASLPSPGWGQVHASPRAPGGGQARASRPSRIGCQSDTFLSAPERAMPKHRLPLQEVKKSMSLFPLQEEESTYSTREPSPRPSSRSSRGLSPCPSSRFRRVPDPRLP